MPETVTRAWWTTCTDCQRLIPPGAPVQPALPPFTSDGYGVCPECTGRQSTCAVCGNTMAPNERAACVRRTTGVMFAAVLAVYACENCAPTLFECPQHHTFELPHERCEPTGSCWHCDVDIYAGTETTDAYEDTYCATCAVDHLSYCHSCSQYFPSDEINGNDECAECQREADDDDDGGCDCYSCRRDRASGAGSIHGYSYRPALNFHGNGPVYLGWELELSDDYGRGPAIVAEQDPDESLMYLKDDCSINGGGFELVTHPMSYAYAMDAFPWQMLSALRENGASGGGNGLHVHVSRTGFSSPAHLYRWLKFIYRNQRGVVAIARRDSNEWAPFYDDDRRQQRELCKGKGYVRSRYAAINLTNEHTVEVRVFASSTNPNHVKAALALVAASVEYTRNLTVPTILGGGWTWDALMHWAESHAEYAPLTDEWQRLNERYYANI